MKVEIELILNLHLWRHVTYYKHQVDDTIVGLFSKIQLAKIKFNLFGSLDLPAESFRDHVVEGGGVALLICFKLCKERCTPSNIVVSP